MYLVTTSENSANLKLTYGPFDVSLAFEEKFSIGNGKMAYRRSDIRVYADEESLKVALNWVHKQQY